MDCLPADPLTGKPLNTARDLNLLAWASQIPRTGLPVLIGGALAWFPSHMVAFRTFWTIGGCMGLLSTAMLIFFIHPRDEPLDKTFQCSRSYYHAQYDAIRRTEQAEKEERERAANSARSSFERQTGPSQIQSSRQTPPPWGARLCDRMLFGYTTTSFQPESEQTRSAAVDRTSRAPLLRATDTGN